MQGSCVETNRDSSEDDMDHKSQITAARESFAELSTKE